MISGVKVTFDKTFEPHVPGQRQALEAMGLMAAEMLRDRVDGQGRHAEGRLPEVSSDPWWYASAKDLRFRGDKDLAPRYTRGHKGPGQPELAVALQGYAQFKRGKSGKTRRGQSLTGTAWDNLLVSIKDRGTADKRVVVGFGGSVKTGFVTKDGKKKAVRVRNREKMMLTQFKKRDHKEWQDGSPKGRADFTLMALTNAELFRLRDYYLSRLRMFR